MALVLKTASLIEPVTLQEAKLFAQVTDTAEDSLLTSLIVGARTYAEQYTNRQFVTATWYLYLDGFPTVIQPPRPPLQTAGFSIKYIDTAGAEQTLSSSLYQVDVKSSPGRVAPAYAQVWPSVRTETLNVVTVEFQAGYGAAASGVPFPVRQAIMLLVSDWFRYRQDAYDGRPFVKAPRAVDSLLSQYKVWQS